MSLIQIYNDYLVVVNYVKCERLNPNSKKSASRECEALCSNLWLFVGVPIDVLAERFALVPVFPPVSYSVDPILSEE